jgi:carboxymethylenebutenolidase
MLRAVCFTWRVPDITFPVGNGDWPGYLAVPAAAAGPWPAVVVIHEAFGLTDDIRGKAAEFAARGYLALAPDLFDGRSWIRCIRSAFVQLRAGRGPAFAALDAASAYLAARPDCTGKTGVIGFCLGGGFALLCAPRAGFDVAAVNYGDVPKDADSALVGACPVVASYGGRDPMGTRHPERLERALSVRDVPHDVRIYPEAGHRFMSQASGASATVARIVRMSYRPEDAADAWERIFGFFGDYLGGKAEEPA